LNSSPASKELPITDVLLVERHNTAIAWLVREHDNDVILAGIQLRFAEK
jgi:hypothetical protein